jgi:hypothetical protein
MTQKCRVHNNRCALLKAKHGDCFDAFSLGYLWYIEEGEDNKYISTSCFHNSFTYGQWCRYFNDDEYLYVLKISDIYFRFNLTTSVKVKVIPQHAEVAQGVPGR